MNIAIKKVLLGVASIGFVYILLPTNVSALGLTVAPLEYRTTLTKDDKRKQGFVDVSNPLYQAVNVAVSVQAFRQINDQGGLQFYDDKQVALGIKTNLTNFRLGSREVLRMSFSIDGANLPKGDVYAAIFFTTSLKQARSGVGQSVRVGTILSIINDSPGSRKAEVTNLSIPFLQFTDSVKGAYSIKNTGPKAGGFYPTVAINAWPGTTKKNHQSSLVFGGRERKNDFSYQVGMGIHLVEVSFGASKKSQWVINVPLWALIATLLVIVITCVELSLFKKRRKLRKKVTQNKTIITPED